MVQAAAMSGKFWHGNEGFPILFEDGNLRVYKNPTNEVFVEEVASGVTIRINAYPYARGCGLQFTTDALVEPTVVNNTIGWAVRRR